MKKIYMLLLVILFTFLTGCSKDVIKEYTGKEISKLTFKSVDYNGGYTTIYELDFENNIFSKKGYMPTDVNDIVPEVVCDFTDEDERIFMNECYSYGLFDIKEKYQATGIVDGGGWDLELVYIDGTKKLSRGDNASPTEVFSKCATSFYDLCGDPVLGMLPEYYAYPPNVSYSFEYFKDDRRVWDNSFAWIVRANYKWNKSEDSDVNIFLLNEENKHRNKFKEGIDYKLTLYTANYDCKEKYKNLIVYEYDYNKDLTNETIIHSGKWEDQITVDIKLNKIYVYKLIFKDKDYVEYTFSTYVNE